MISLEICLPQKKAHSKIFKSPKAKVDIVMQWMKPQLGFDTDAWDQVLIPFLIQLPANIHNERQQMMAQGCGSLSSTWETQMKFQASSFDLVKPWFLQTFGE